MSCAQHPDDERPRSGGLRGSRRRWTSSCATRAAAARFAPVAAPLPWSEVEEGRFDPQRHTLRTMPRRVERDGDPWSGITRRGRSFAGVVIFWRRCSSHHETPVMPELPDVEGLLRTLERQGRGAACAMSRSSTLLSCATARRRHHCASNCADVISPAPIAGGNGCSPVPTDPSSRCTSA